MPQRENLRFLRRISLQAGGSLVVPVSAVGATLTGATIQLPKLDPTQALRIIAGAQRFQDAANSGKLTILGSNVAMYTVTGAPLRAWSPGIANVVSGLAGVTWGWIDDEYVHGSDYLEVLVAGDSPGVFKVISSADVSNSDGVATHTLGSLTTILVELYQMTIETPR